jgi:SAM-dependent methyltransferase
MSIFDAYAAYYDLLYQDKDYKAECDFLEQIFARYAQAPIRTILDLGCGTGGHALLLGRQGYEVVGVDCSEKMLAAARVKAASALERSNLVLSEANVVPMFQPGDIRNLDLGHTFDAVIAMFAVISYQTTNEDLLAAFRTARRHLRPGGLFVFDAWFGPAVLTERPTDRVKIVEVNGRRIIRFASPVMDVTAHTVQVRYKVLQLSKGQVVDEVDETHLVRFLFPQEVAYYLQEAGLELTKLCPFLALDRELTLRDWNMTVVARRALLNTNETAK